MCNKEVIPIDPSTTSIATHEMNEEAALSTSTSTSFPLSTSSLVESVWKSLCSDLQIPSSLTASWWEIIFLEYTRPYRAYHTLQHLQEFIELYQQYSFALRSPSSPSQPLSSSHHIFLLAIFFHDLIYHPTTPQTNEDESILFFRLFVKECQAITPHDHLHQISPLVIELIDLTKKHQFGEDPQLLNPPHNAMLFCDMDMAILGSSRGRYEEYSQQVACILSLPSYSCLGSI